MRSFYLHQTTILHFFAATIILITYVSAAPANTIPYLISPFTSANNTTTAPPTLSVWPTLPWWTKLRNTNLDPPAFLEIISVGPQAFTSQQTYTLLEIVLLPLAQQIHQGTGPANETEAVTSGGVRAEFVPVEGRAPNREVAATGVAALAMAEWKFGARGVRAGSGWGR